MLISIGGNVMTNLDLKQSSVYLKSTKFKEFISPKNWHAFLSPLKTPFITKLIEQYQADKSVKKLFTNNLICLYLFIGLTAGKTVTLRLIEIISCSKMAQFFTVLKGGVSRSGLSDRNEAIPCNLFRDIVLNLAHRTKRSSRRLMREAKNEIKIFDTTFISLAHKLIPWACRSVTKGLVSLAVRIDSGSWLPDRLIIRNEPGDNTIFRQLIDWTRQGVTYLFDRGFNEFETLKKLTQSGNFFITRLPSGYVYQIIKKLKIRLSIGEGITLIKDEIIRVGGKSRREKFKARLVTAVNDKGESILFFTNRFDLTAIEVCEIYRQRWQIEILFRWLKTQLKIERVISYNENGFYLQIYMALILHLLIMLYHAKQCHKSLTALGVYRHLQSWLYDLWGNYMFRLGMSISQPALEEVLCYG
jgi:hypothetical protein